MLFAEVAHWNLLAFAVDDCDSEDTLAQEFPQHGAEACDAGSLRGRLWTHQTSCGLASSPRVCRRISECCFLGASTGGPWLNLVVRGCVVFEAIISFDPDRAALHVQDHVTEASTTDLISVGNKRLKVFLQVREVAVLDFAFFASVILSGVALDVFVHAFIA